MIFDNIKTKSELPDLSKTVLKLVTESDCEKKRCQDVSLIPFLWPVLSLKKPTPEKDISEKEKEKYQEEFEHFQQELDKKKEEFQKGHPDLQGQPGKV